MYMQKNILIYDIETKTGGNMDNPENHIIKRFGFYSYKDNQYHITNDLKVIQKVINNHKILVGFNNINYDNRVLIGNGINLDFKVNLDLYKVIKKRAGLIKLGNTFLSYVLRNYNLDTIVKTLKLDEGGKLDFDYSILEKDENTEEEIKLIDKYLLKDLEITKKLFMFVYNQFDSWKHYINDKDRKNLKHLSCAQSVYTYKVLAEKCGFEEEYDDTKEKSKLTSGGYVSYPAIEKLEGNIYCLDYSSLYPHIMIMCNLYGRLKNGEQGWNGGGKWKINGTYNDKEMHKTSKVLMEIYNERKQLKKDNNPKEYGLKVSLNTIYGILRNPSFKNVYDDIAGNDICLIGQQWILLARKKFKEAGYFVFYTDTDSVYLEDKFNDKERLMKIKNEIINEIKNSVPFPVDTFDMDIDYKIAMIHFFKGGNKKQNEELIDEDDIKNKELGLMKKNYIFLYYDNNNDIQLFIKNLGIVKRNNTQLSKKIFWEKMVPLIKETYNCKFDSNLIYTWIKEYLKKDIFLISKRIGIGNIKNYKSNTCIQVQAYNYIPKNKTEKLGSGIHYFIPNKKIGIGKNMIKYCTIDEYNDFLNYNDIYIENVMRELRYFNSNYVIKKLKKEKYIPIEKQLMQKKLF